MCRPHALSSLHLSDRRGILLILLGGRHLDFRGLGIPHLSVRVLNRRDATVGARLIGCRVVVDGRAGGILVAVILRHFDLGLAVVGAVEAVDTTWVVSVVILGQAV